MSLIPNSISVSEVAQLLKELSEADSYVGTEGDFKSIDFNCVDFTLSYWFSSDSKKELNYDACMLLLKSLPNIIDCVSEKASIPVNDGKHYLSWIDVTDRGRSISVWFQADEYNSQWNLDFVLQGGRYRMS